MSDVNKINSIKDIDFNTLKNTYNVFLENELSQIEDNGIYTNKHYFQNVYHKAIRVFDEIFDSKDQMKLIHSISTNNIFPRKSRFSEKFLTKQIASSYKYEQIIKTDDVFKISNVFTYQCKKKDIKYGELIKAICNQDFPKLTPNINQQETFSSIYFINIDKGILFHLYDDRGFIIVFSDVKDFETFKQRHEELEIEKYTEYEI
ncbi:DUF3885 domain-containing protein [Mammaliicoccus fleurettii]|uniref:DUF3885 domain-containing protein n=1 Tax=Mammaliicoccus fleurettii TaxID=150056 RepID=UPI001AAD6B0E|nr:hypothetical protein [Mammaliicoccus fleurettii]MBO3063744.1 hypothetical protein [Mammaliicoccus fleurettii]